MELLDKRALQISFRTKRNGVIERTLAVKDYFWMLLLFLCSFSLGTDALEPGRSSLHVSDCKILSNRKCNPELKVITAMRLFSVNVKLEIENPCWFHKREDPVLVCTVESMDFWILWRKDWEFLVHDKLIIGDPKLSLTTAKGNNSREAKLRFPFDDAVPLVKEQSQFTCENQGYQSDIFTFGIPDCRECVSGFNQSRSIFSDVNVPKGSIELNIENPSWYSSDSGPVFVCTVSDTEDNILWLLGEEQIESVLSTNSCTCDKSLQYCSYPVQGNRARQGKLVLSQQRARNLIKKKPEVTCATKTGKRSSSQVLMIQDRRACEKCPDNISGFDPTSPVSGLFFETTPTFTERETSIPSTSSQRLLIAGGTFCVFLLCVLGVILTVCGTRRQRRLKRQNQVVEQGTNLLQINDRDVVSTSNA